MRGREEERKYIEKQSIMCFMSASGFHILRFFSFSSFASCRQFCCILFCFSFLILFWGTKMKQRKGAENTKKTKRNNRTRRKQISLWNFVVRSVFSVFVVDFHLLRFRFSFTFTFVFFLNFSFKTILLFRISIFCFVRVKEDETTAQIDYKRFSTTSIFKQQKRKTKFANEWKIKRAHIAALVSGSRWRMVYPVALDESSAKWKTNSHEHCNEREKCGFSLA